MLATKFNDTAIIFTSSDTTNSRPRVKERGIRGTVNANSRRRRPVEVVFRAKVGGRPPGQFYLNKVDAHHDKKGSGEQIMGIGDFTLLFQRLFQSPLTW